jgi:hypothetical protein
MKASHFVGGKEYFSRLEKEMTASDPRDRGDFKNKNKIHSSKNPKAQDFEPRMQEGPASPRNQREEPDLLSLVVLHPPLKSARTTQARIFAERSQQDWILQSQIQHKTGATKLPRKELTAPRSHTNIPRW